MILLAYCWVWYVNTRVVHWLTLWTCYPLEMMKR